LIRKAVLPRIITLVAAYAVLLLVLVKLQFPKKETRQEETGDQPEVVQVEDFEGKNFTFDEVVDEVKAKASFDGLELTAFYEPQYFSPDNDGENDMLYITLGIEGGKDPASWMFDIFQPELAGSTRRIFKHFEGKGVPNERLVWNGYSDTGELVQAATDYPYAFTITGTGDTVSEPLNGQIHVDVLVRRGNDGRLQIQVPSIIFRTNAADFLGLPEDTVANNDRVIRRIAAILNKFPDYKVRVEGHANPENLPDTQARSREDAFESASGSISERRAEAIVRFLSANGVNRSRLTAIGMGISKPIIQYSDRDNWWQNRRVEFYLDKD
jgi:hypothetical protein